MTAALIDVTELQALMVNSANPANPADPTTAPLVIDCSFDLADTAAGERAFGAAHVPGAVYFHLGRDLSAPHTGRNGRHPLPERAAFAERLAAAGVSDETLVVACDASGGVYAARLWWMAQWVGHARVRVLDGGLSAWRAAGGAVVAGPAAARAPGRLTLRPSLVASVDHATLRASLGQRQRLVVDARAADRFRGENETLDPVGGHIPGAANRCFRDNLGVSGAFKPEAQLRQEWLALMAGRSASELVHSCGSGVTACHNLLALASAGLPGAALYAGSWSEWCAQPGAPIAVGD